MRSVLTIICIMLAAGAAFAQGEIKHKPSSAKESTGKTTQKAQTQKKSKKQPAVNISASTGQEGSKGFVDLGLPSGTLWAISNLGTDNAEDSGEFYAWGELEPKSEYTRLTWTVDMLPSGVLTEITGNPKYDAATYKLGTPWELPTEADFRELQKECKWDWVTLKGKKGYKLTGPNGNSIFLPAAGWIYRDSDNCVRQNSVGMYWAGTTVDIPKHQQIFHGGSIPTLQTYPQCFYIDDYCYITYGSERSSQDGLGYMIRPVIHF